MKKKILRRTMEKKFHTKDEFEYTEKLNDYFHNSIGTTIEKLDNFTKYVTRQKMATILVHYEIFKKIVNVHGSIIECGVHFGSGLMAYAHFSAILEPVANQRKIIGFDTFTGFPSLKNKDKGSTSDLAVKGGYASNAHDDLKKCIEVFDSNRFLSHIPKIELVKGNAVHTIPKYLKKNPHTLVSLLHLDFDLYEPTKVALKNFVPRMPKGAIIVFDEINDYRWPGETLAVLETIGVRDYKIERFPFDPDMSYAVLD